MKLKRKKFKEERKIVFQKNRKKQKEKGEK